MSATAVAFSALAMHCLLVVGIGLSRFRAARGPEMTNAPTQTGRGAKEQASSSCVGRRGNPGPSTDFSSYVLFAQALIGDRRSLVELVKNSLPPADQPKRCYLDAERARLPADTPQNVSTSRTLAST